MMQTNVNDMNWNDYYTIVYNNYDYDYFYYYHGNICKCMFRCNNEIK